MVVAAKGLRLRRLILNHDVDMGLWKPFAVRTLLPGWVGIAQWGRFEETFEQCDFGGLPGWEYAAVRLRRSLSHMSKLRIITQASSAAAGASRLLTRSAVQAMHEEFKTSGLPPLENQEAVRALGKYEAMWWYFRWLREDVKLAQQVADAWNAVVERGEADLCECYCLKCCTAARSAGLL